MYSYMCIQFIGSVRNFRKQEITVSYEKRVHHKAFFPKKVTSLNLISFFLQSFYQSQQDKRDLKIFLKAASSIFLTVT